MSEQIKSTKLNLLRLFLKYAFKCGSSELFSHEVLWSNLIPFSNKRIQVVNKFSSFLYKKSWPEFRRLFCSVTVRKWINSFFCLPFDTFQYWILRSLQFVSKVIVLTWSKLKQLEQSFSTKLTPLRTTFSF